MSKQGASELKNNNNKKLILAVEKPGDFLDVRWTEEGQRRRIYSFLKLVSVRFQSSRSI